MPYRFRLLVLSLISTWFYQECLCYTGSDYLYYLCFLHGLIKSVYTIQVQITCTIFDFYMVLSRVFMLYRFRLLVLSLISTWFNQECLYHTGSDYLYYLCFLHGLIKSVYTVQVQITCTIFDFYMVLSRVFMLYRFRLLVLSLISTWFNQECLYHTGSDYLYYLCFLHGLIKSVYDIQVQITCTIFVFYMV